MISELKEYVVPGVLACVLHVFLAVSPNMLGFAPDFANDDQVFEPKALSATLLRLEPKQMTLPVMVVPPDNPQPIAQPEEAVDEDQRRREELEEAARLENVKRLQLLAELRDKSFKDSLENELQVLQDGDMNDAASSYVVAIYAAVVSKWTRPPSARNDMEAVVRVELLPSGELNSVALVKSSGNSAYDRSALSAVRNVEKFMVPDDTVLFDSRFRSFTLRFNAKDLLR